MPTTRPHPLALLTASVACALSGCGSSDDYPRDWPAVETAWFRSCPDLAGTYELDHRAPPVVRTSYDAKPPWERLVISGRPGGDLRFTATRTVKPAADAEPWNPPRNSLEQAQADMRAQAKARATAAGRDVPTEATQLLAHDAYRCWRGRLTLQGGYVLARDESHGLVGRGRHVRTTGQVDVWCGDGCQGIPLGFEVQHLWQRWSRSDAVP